jgi:glycosyltransferase involved in cell wall biosynthesis
VIFGLIEYSTIAALGLLLLILAWHRPGLLGCGLLVDVRSPSKIALGMRTLLEDNNLAGVLGHSGRRRALNGYRLEEVAARYEGVLAKEHEEPAH